MTNNTAKKTFDKTGRTGRPPLPPDRVRNQRVTVRFTRAELDAIADECVEESITEAVRELALKSHSKIRKRKTSA